MLSDNKKNGHRPMMRMTVLAMSLCAVHSSVYAMQAMNEQELRAINAQDGIILDTSYDSINIDRLYWEDKVGMVDGSDTALRAYADGVSITGNNLGTTYRVNAGSDAATGKAGVDLSIVSRYGTIAADAFKICDNTGANCGQSPFGLTVQSTKDAKLHFITQDGLFSPTSLSTAEISLVDVNIYLSNLENTAQPLSSTINQLILKGFNFNVKGQGYMYVDPIKGLVLSTEPGSGTGTSGYFDLNRVCTDAASCATDGLKAWNSKPGLNIDIVAKKNSGNTNGKTTYNVNNTSGMIRVGASGRLKNASLTIRGTNGATDTNGAILGKAYSAGNSTFTPDSGSVNIMGSSGIAMRVKADFTNDGSNPTTLELGHGGDNAYALQFSNFSPLLIRKQNNGGAFNPDAAYFDSGNVYVNLANTKRLALPENSALNAAPFLAEKLTTSDDYKQLVHSATGANPNAVVVATRGTEFQALSRQTQFIASPDVYKDNITANDPVGGGSWGLGLPFYNLNSNLAIYGTTFSGKPYGSAAVENAQRLGFALGMTTQGVSADGSKTTSILLIDGKKYGTALDANNVRQASSTGDPINYYIGVRNIDMLLKGYGSIGMENGSLNLNIPDFMLSAAGQVAVGYLPGSQYKTSLGGTAKYAPIDGFLTNSDVLFGLRLRMAGSVDMTMVPGSTESNFISFDGNLNLTSGAVQIVEPVDGSILGFDNITGKLGFSNQIKIHKDNVDFNTAFTVNPDRTATDVLRIKDVNLYPATYTGNVPTGVGAAQRLGEIALTGGLINSKFNITPH